MPPNKSQDNPKSDIPLTVEFKKIETENGVFEGQCKLMPNGTWSPHGYGKQQLPDGSVGEGEHYTNDDSILYPRGMVSVRRDNAIPGKQFECELYEYEGYGVFKESFGVSIPKYKISTPLREGTFDHRLAIPTDSNESEIAVELHHLDISESIYELFYAEKISGEVGGALIPNGTGQERIFDETEDAFYNGEYTDGKYKNGTLIRVNDEALISYTGNFHENEKHGEGKEFIVFKKPDTYGNKNLPILATGVWQNGMRNGPFRENNIQEESFVFYENDECKYAFNIKLDGSNIIATIDDNEPMDPMLFIKQIFAKNPNFVKNIFSFIQSSNIDFQQHNWWTVHLFGQDIGPIKDMNNPRFIISRVEKYVEERDIKELLVSVHNDLSCFSDNLYKLTRTVGGLLELLNKRVPSNITEIFPLASIPQKLMNGSPTAASQYKNEVMEKYMPWILTRIYLIYERRRPLEDTQNKLIDFNKSYTEAFERKRIEEEQKRKEERENEEREKLRRVIAQRKNEQRNIDRREKLEREKAEREKAEREKAEREKAQVCSEKNSSAQLAEPVALEFFAMTKKKAPTKISKEYFTQLSDDEVEKFIMVSDGLLRNMNRLGGFDRSYVLGIIFEIIARNSKTPHLIDGPKISNDWFEFEKRKIQQKERDVGNRKCYEWWLAMEETANEYLKLFEESRRAMAPMMN